MNTLSMLWAEGFEEGFRKGFLKGKKEAKAICSLLFFLRLFIKLPNLSLTDFTNLTEYKEDTIEAFLKVLKTKKNRAIQFYIRKYLLAGIELSKAEKKEIYSLVKIVVAQEDTVYI